MMRSLLSDAAKSVARNSRGLLKDAALTHEQAEGFDADLERHRAAADLINRIIAGGINP
jgi:hypothetical protein